MVSLRWSIIFVFLVFLILLDVTDGQRRFGGRGRGGRGRGGGRGGCGWLGCPPAPAAGSCEANQFAWCTCVNSTLVTQLQSFTTVAAIETALEALTPAACSITTSTATTLAGCPDVLRRCLSKQLRDCYFLELLCVAAGNPTVSSVANGDEQIAAATTEVPNKLCLYYRTFALLPSSAGTK